MVSVHKHQRRIINLRSGVLVITLILLLLVVLLPETRNCYASTGSGEVVQFKDTNLEATVRNTLKKPSGDITDADMATLTSLTAQNRISDLGGGWSLL